MKILQILPALQMGGVERGTIEIAAALKAAGVDNVVISAGGPMTAQLDALGVRHYTLPVNSKNPFVIRANAGRIAEIVRQEGVSLMHVRSRAPAWSVKWAARRCAVPWIATFHGVYGTSPRLLKIPYNRIMLEGERTICVSDYVMRHVLETYHPDPSRLVRIHRGADVDFFSPSAVIPNEVEMKKTKQYGFSPDIPILTLPGRLTYWKGQEVLIEAVSKMRHRRLGVLFVGSDQGRFEYSDRLRTLAGRLSDETEVVFRDHTSEMQKVYAMSDVVINASSAQPEAFGRTIPEAQAMGRLVVATAHGGACETIQDGVTGWLVPPGDADALARKLDEILDLNETVLDAVRQAAVRSVRENFSTQRMCERTLALYHELHRKI